MLLAAVVAQAQTGGVRVGTAGPPDASAALDVDATTKGFLPPRLTQAQRDAIAAPAAGLTVFNTSTNQLNVWDGVRWVAYLTDNTPLNATAAPVFFAYTGAPQTYTVPTGVTRLGIDLTGGGGGPRNSSSPNGRGLGGRVQATLAVTPGEVLTIVVGGAGGATSGGYNGGGGGYSGGGGASDVRQGGTALTNRVLVAGGGGGDGNTGAGGCGGPTACAGESTSLGPYNSTGGGGGTATGPGAGGTGSFVGPGQGGSGPTGGAGSYYGGGGGGGYYGGGGGGDFSGGGGGSSYAGPGTSAVVHSQGVQAGNGYVRIYLSGAVAAAPVLDASNFVDVPGDNLGNHTATQNIRLGNNFITNDGRSRGLTISGNGSVVLGSSTTNTATNGSYQLQVTGGATRLAADGAEESLYGLDAVVGYNDLRFSTDDNRNTERLHINGGSTAATAGNVGVGTPSPDARLDVNGYLRVAGANDAPTIGTVPSVAYLKLTATMPTTAGNQVVIDHGLNVSKILGLQVLVDCGNNNHVPPSFTDNSSELYYAYLNGGRVVLRAGASGTSGSVLGRPARIILTYEP